MCSLLLSLRLYVGVGMWVGRKLLASCSADWNSSDKRVIFSLDVGYIRQVLWIGLTLRREANVHTAFVGFIKLRKKDEKERSRSR